MQGGHWQRPSPKASSRLTKTFVPTAPAHAGRPSERALASDNLQCRAPGFRSGCGPDCPAPSREVHRALSKSPGHMHSLHELACGSRFSCNGVAFQIRVASATVPALPLRHRTGPADTRELPGVGSLIEAQQGRPDTAMSPGGRCWFVPCGVPGGASLEGGELRREGCSPPRGPPGAPQSATGASCGLPCGL